jgi:hypothetical protein
MNRRVDTERTWKVSAAEGFNNPFVASGEIDTIQGNLVKASCQCVIGTTTCNGRAPTASELTITAGRILVISAPTVGAKSSIQMCPLLILMKWLSIERLPERDVRISPVVFFSFSGSIGHVLAEHVKILAGAPAFSEAISQILSNGLD